MGIAAASGTYMLINDADDWMEDNCLEVLAGKAKETQADRIVGYSQRVDPEGKIFRIITYDENMSRWLFTDLQGCIFKRSVFQEHNITCPSDVLEDDLYLASVFSSHAESYAVCDEVVFNIFSNPKSTFSSATANRTIDFIKDFIRIHSEFKGRLNSTDLEDFEYMIIKAYYHGVLNQNRKSSFFDIAGIYKKARSVMRNSLPLYLKNRNIVLFKKNGDRPSGRKITWLLATCEKLHLVFLFLFFFVLLNKITDINK